MGMKDSWHRLTNCIPILVQVTPRSQKMTAQGGSFWGKAALSWGSRRSPGRLDNGSWGHNKQDSHQKYAGSRTGTFLHAEGNTHYAHSLNALGRPKLGAEALFLLRGAHISKGQINNNGADEPYELLPMWSIVLLCISTAKLVGGCIVAHLLELTFLFPMCNVPLLILRVFVALNSILLNLKLLPQLLLGSRFPGLSLPIYPFRFFCILFPPHKMCGFW